MYAVLTYDAETVCGSLDACFAVFGPYNTYDDAESALARVSAENGLDGEVLFLNDPASDNN